MTTTAMRRARRDDEASTEVIGYILSFAISAVILVVSTQAFLRAQQNTDHVVNGVELRTVASRVASRLVETGVVAQEFPNATLTIRMRMAESIGDYGYSIELRPDKVTTALVGDGLSAESTTFKLDKVAHVAVSGTAYASNGHVVIKYEQTRYAEVRAAATCTPACPQWTMPTNLGAAAPDTGEIVGTPALENVWYVKKSITITSG